MGPAETFKEVAGLSLPDAAARYAQIGVPIFPCVPNGKNPLTRHGFHDATTDPAQVGAWWRRWPDANIGLPTGQASGVEVVDVDRKASGDGFGAFTAARKAGLASGWLALVRTPSGGMHAYYPANPDRPQPSWQAGCAHVDFRADGGYIIAPPSVVINSDGERASYTLTGGPDGSARFVNGRALRDFLDPRPSTTASPRHSAMSSPDAERLASWVAGRGEGERNHGLFWASCRLSEAGLALPQMLDALSDAGERAGLSPREVVTTIRSAYRATNVAPGTPPGGQAQMPNRPARLVGQVIA
jgi:hypothetical protein